MLLKITSTSLKQNKIRNKGKLQIRTYKKSSYFLMLFTCNYEVLIINFITVIC